MKSKLSAIFLFLAFVPALVSAQDVIVKKTKQEIEAKVLEIGLDAIRYQPADYPDGPVISIAIEDVWKVRFANGSEWINTPDPYDMNSAMEARDRNRAIKFDFFSPMFGKFTIGYETMIKIGMNLEVKAGIIGPSLNTEITNNNPSGALFMGGLKFLFGSEHMIRGMKRTHALYGSYFKPEIVFSSFSQNYEVYRSGFTTLERRHITSYGINLVFGKQSIFGNIFTLDWHFGIGYGGQSNDLEGTVQNYENQGMYEPYCFSHLYTGPGFPLIYTAGVTIGFLIK